MQSLISLLKGSRESSLQSYFCAGLLLLGLACLLLARSPAAGVKQDFIPLYGGARCVLHGCDPYSSADQQSQIVQAGGPWALADFWRAFSIVYPPLTYLLLSGIALLRWQHANLVWSALNFAAFSAGLAAIIQASPPKMRWLAAVIVTGIAATSSMLLAMGQLTLLVVGLLGLACALILRNRPKPGFLVMTLAVALKPQLGGLLLAYFLIKRKTRRWAVAALAALFLMNLAAGRPGPGWFAKLRRE